MPRGKNDAKSTLRNTKQKTVIRLAWITYYVQRLHRHKPDQEYENIPWPEACNVICPDKPAIIEDKKQGQYFIPCPLKEAPLVGNTLEAAKRNGQPTIGKMRSKHHVTEASMLVMDIDGLCETDFINFLNALSNAGITFLAFTTHSHGNPEKPGMRVRIVIPLDRSLSIEEYAAAWHGIDQCFFGGEAGKADASGANLYQQQGTWCCHPSRVDQAQTWKNNGGVASADALIETGRAIFGEQSVKELSATQHADFTTSDKEYPISDANKVANACKQIGVFRDLKGANQSEPAWNACLGVVGHCQDGPAISQDWSSAHSGYDRVKTAKKLEHRLKTPPTTCAYFKKINPAGCEGCPHQINSPITLGWSHDKDKSDFKDLGFETEVVVSGEQITDGSTSTRNSILLNKFSLSGRSHEIEKHMVEEKPVLGQIALNGQITNLFSDPNAGKTLLTLSQLIQSIEQGQIDPSKLYYLNMDDNSNGLLEKLRIAEEYGFHMLADGYLDFNANQFIALVVEMIENDQTHGVIIILDTLKKVVDLMDKSKSAYFMKVMRRFVLKGRTVIALAHTNKHPGKDGKPMYGGVSDIVNDCDCAYTLEVVTRDANTNEVVVEFTNIKRRGNVVQNVAYSYRTGHGISYLETLLSVRQYDDTQLVPLKQAVEVKEDAKVIEVVIACLGEGINTKMKLAAEVGARASISRQSAIRIIEKYTGTDPKIHKWEYTKGNRGAQIYALRSSVSGFQNSRSPACIACPAWTIPRCMLGVWL